VVAHEYTHAITHFTAQIPVIREPGAVNESTSDIFAAATQAYTAGSITSATWKIAEDVYTPGIGGDALRHLNDPAINPGHQDYYPARVLNAETHHNAGPMNLAFYLLVTGGQHPRGDTTIVVPSIGMSAAEKIFYRGLHYYANSKTNYRLMREHTLTAAADLYGANSTQQNAVRDAWSAVGSDWTTATAVLSLGQSFAYPSYTTTAAGVHTGQLEGPAGTNFNLYFERWDGSAWVLVTRQLGATSTELIESTRPAGTYRWRITCAEGSGTSTLHTNTPK
jgi:vibriolysin